MDHTHTKYMTLEVFNFCNIKSFPIDCFSIIKEYGLEAVSYSSLYDGLKNYCLMYSDDAFKYKNLICYNDDRPNGRVRFSLMHELAHILLGHQGDHTSAQEQDANFFASNVLAPRMAIHYAGCKNQSDVSKLFHITDEAAHYAFADYRRWYRRTVYYKMNSFDKAMYSHFYSKEQDKFVYSIKRCAYCGDEIYNSRMHICPKCNRHNYNFFQNVTYDTDLLIAENQWLYGGL
jgi:hypothetical protein